MSVDARADSADAVWPASDDAHQVQTVVLADVEGMARQVLASLLRELEGVTVVEVGTREELAHALRRRHADTLIIDDRLVEDGHHVLAGLGPGNGAAQVIVIGVDDDPAYAARAHRLGARAWVAKDRAVEDLVSRLEP